MENLGKLKEVLHHQYEKAFQMWKMSEKTKLRNAMERYEGKYHTHSLSEKYDIRLH